MPDDVIIIHIFRFNGVTSLRVVIFIDSGIIKSTKSILAKFA